MARITAATQSDYTGPIAGKRVIEYPLLEQDIIHLHQLFLTNGFHDIVVKNIASGRQIIQSLLSSLQLYQDIAVVTVETIPHDYSVFNVYQQLVTSIVYNNEQVFEELFYEYFNFDFMWIEKTDDLRSNTWYCQFEQKMRRLGLHHHMPIIQVSYDQ